MAPKSCGGRDRNKTRFSKWGFYLKGEEPRTITKNIKKLRDTCDTSRARVPGGGNTEKVVLEKVTDRRVELTWPKPISHDNCARVLCNALGSQWKDYVTKPAGVPGFAQEAATADGGGGHWAGAVWRPGGGHWAEEPEASLEDVIAQGLFPDADGPSESSAPAAARHVAADPDTAPTAVSSEGRSHLLPLRLEAVGEWYSAKDRSKFEEMPCEYDVDWRAGELGQGTYGKVYFGTRRGDKRGLAIKMLRDDPQEDADKGFNTDAHGAADDEVRRHGTLGVHSRLVRLIDVGLFRQVSSSAAEERGPRPRVLQQSQVPRPAWNFKDHIGLVFDLYEIDVRQFLQKSSFTESGMRHVLNSVLDGLQYIHDKGCVHTDIKPANILMRGSAQSRGCFRNEVLTPRSLGEWDPVPPDPKSQQEFQYMIPRSFEALGSQGCSSAQGALTWHVRAPREL